MYLFIARLGKEALPLPCPVPHSTLTSWELSELLIWSSMSGTTCKGPLREDKDCLQGRCHIRLDSSLLPLTCLQSVTLDPASTCLTWLAVLGLSVVQ